MTRIPFVLLLLACGTDTDSGETVGETGEDTTDTGETGDTGSTGETGGSGDTSDTSVPPPPTTGYFGPPALAVLADDGAGAAKLVLVDPMSGVATAIPDLNVPRTATVGCAGPYIWVLSTNDGTIPDVAYGVDARNLVINKTLALSAGFDARAVTYNDAFWFGGEGSASLVSFDSDGAAGATLDLSSLADSDGLPEVRSFVQSDIGVAAILARNGDTGFNPSAVAFLDLTAATLVSSGSLAGVNAGSMAASTPGGLMVDMAAHGTSGGAIELFDTTSLATGGNVLDFTDVTRLATITAGDGTLFVAATAEGVTTVYHYQSDGADFGSLVTKTLKNSLALVPPYLWSGEGVGTAAAVVGYDLMTSAAASTITIGSDIYGLTSCSPPPRIPDDTGDTAPPQ